MSRRNLDSLTLAPSFSRTQPATSVSVTGTFDDWSQSVTLEKNGSDFEKTVELPSSADKILYKVRIREQPSKARDMGI